jgi:hypothetical protein
MNVPSPPSSASVVGRTENSLTLSINSPPTTIISASYTSNPISITGLNESTSYVFSYMSYFDNTRSDASSITISTTPAIPSVNSVNVLSSNSASLTFTRNDTLGYTYDISATPAAGSLVVSDTNIAGTSYTFSGVKALAPSMQYTMDLYAVSSIGTKRKVSNTITTYTVAPTVTATVYDISASLAIVPFSVNTYSGSLNRTVASYSVRGAGTATDVSSNLSPLRLTDLSESTVYDISVVSLYANTQSDVSSLAITTYPTPPTSVTATTLSSTTASVNFTQNTLLSYSYDISAVPTGGTQTKVSDLSGTNIPYSFIGLSPGTTHNYYVYAKSPITGLKSLYARASNNIITLATAATSIVANKITSSGLDLSYTVVSSYPNGAGAFASVDISYAIRGSTQTRVNSTSQTKYTFSGLTAISIYDLSLVINYASAKSEMATYSFTTLPTTPTFTIGTVGNTSIDIIYTPLANLAYDISAIKVTGLTFAASVSGATTSPQSLTGLTAATQYSFYMWARSTANDSLGIKSAASAPTNKYTLAPQVIPGVYPNGYYLSMTYNTAVVNESGTFNSVTYTYRVTSGGSVNTLTTSTSPYNLTGLSPSTQYDVSSTVTYGNTISVTYFNRYTTLSPPPAPTNVSMSYISPNITVTWTNPDTTRTKNMVIIYTSGGAVQFTSPDQLSTATTYTVSTTTAGITINGNYYARVMSFNQDVSSISASSSNVNVVINITISNKLVYYNFEGNANDVWGTTAYNGTLNGTPLSSVQAKFGTQSLKPNGTVNDTKFVSCPSFTFTTSNGLSISFWTYNLGNTSGDVKVFEFTTESLMMWKGSNVTKYNIANDISWNMNDNLWNHVVITINSSNTTTIYLNNVLVNSKIVSGLLPSGTISSGGRIGRSLGSLHNSFNGYIDDFRIYNKVLTSSEVGYIYNNTAT